MTSMSDVVRYALTGVVFVVTCLVLEAVTALALEDYSVWSSMSDPKTSLGGIVALASFASVAFGFIIYQLYTSQHWLSGLPVLRICGTDQAGRVLRILAEPLDPYDTVNDRAIGNLSNEERKYLRQRYQVMARTDSIDKIKDCTYPEFVEFVRDRVGGDLPDLIVREEKVRVRGKEYRPMSWIWRRRKTSSSVDYHDAKNRNVTVLKGLMTHMLTGPRDRRIDQEYGLHYNRYHTLGALRYSVVLAGFVYLVWLGRAQDARLESVSGREIAVVALLCLVVVAALLWSLTRERSRAAYAVRQLCLQALMPVAGPRARMEYRQSSLGNRRQTDLGGPARNANIVQKKAKQRKRLGDRRGRARRPSGHYDLVGMGSTSLQADPLAYLRSVDVVVVRPDGSS